MLALIVFLHLEELTLGEGVVGGRRGGGGKEGMLLMGHMKVAYPVCSMIFQCLFNDSVCSMTFINLIVFPK